MKSDPEKIAEALKLILDPGDQFEVRVLGAGGNPNAKAAGWIDYEYIDRYARSIAHFADTAAIGGGCYFTPQKLKEGVAVRSRHFFPEVRKVNGESTPKLTCDDDIDYRRYLIIDIDPVRAPGHEHDSATDEEKLEALAVSEIIRDWLNWLIRTNIRRPLVVDSGNGFHLYFKIQKQENDCDLSREVLNVLDAKYSNEKVKIDTTVCNPSRILKIPGTIARKGQHTRDRPHRVSSVIVVPDDWEQVRHW